VTDNDARSQPPRLTGRPPAARHRHLHVTRRSFLAAAGLVVAGGAAAAVLELRDRGGRSSEVAGIEATPRTAKTPAGNRGGMLRAYTFDAMPYDTFDPHLTQMGPIVNVHAAVFSRLLRYEDERAGTIAPDLAAATPEQPDGLTYIFRIRDGVRFHDTSRLRAAFPATSGRALTAEDVRLSIERQVDTGSAIGRRFFRRGNWDVIERMETPDARTLVIRTREPVAPMLAFLAGRHAFVIAPETAERGREIATAEALIGTGPFVLESFEERVAVRLRRNPDWFARDGVAGAGRPYLDGYDAYFSPQEDAFQRAAFVRRIVDVTGFVDQGELARAHKTNLADIVREETGAGALLAMRLLLDRPPFLDDRARRALSLAIDRAALIDALYPAIDGAASAKLSGPIAPGAARWAGDAEALARRPGYRAGAAERDQDLREAKALWDAALGGAPIDLRIMFAGIPRTIPERTVEAVRAQLQGALGVNVVSQVDPSGTRLIANAYMRNLEAATEGTVSCTFAIEDGGVDLDDWLYPHFRSGEAMNTYRLQDPQLDALLDRQRREFDVETRRRIGLDAQEYLLANVNARIEIAAPVERRLAWGYVRNSQMPLWYGSAQDLADVWLDTTHPAFEARPASL
jgi:ABC-type transport system substrate-binding protein